MVSKQDILDAAYTLFCERGYSLSMADIAGIVGLKAPSLYSHYSGKDEIVEEMIQREVDKFYAALESSLDLAFAQSCAAGIKMIFSDIINYFSEYSRLRFWRTIPLIPNENLRKNFAAIITRRDGLTTRKMKQIFLKGIESGEIRNTVSEGSIFLYMTMIQGVLDGMLLYPISQGEPLFADQVFDAYWTGVTGTGVTGTVLLTHT